MRKSLLWIVVIGVLLATPLAWGAPITNDKPADNPTNLAYGKIIPQPLSVKLSAQEVYVGESIWLTVSGGVEPYVLITVENKIQVTSRGKNTYQISGLTAGDSGITIGDSKNSAISKVITVLPKR
jgi:hypothetical protein